MNGNYDLLMERVFGENYYSQEEQNDQEIQKYLHNVEKELEFNESKKEESQADQEEI